ncbi:hypothetical protein CEUSTIGMA_g9597.t1 [Chlamydomonas eustigma]|uniref:BRCT domain-containing protein n=1 Tax=Chlamydomonas eustigma TaxID=1157962 RepID=A0A250XGY0_9CHLO|nr:hypothetical protein CEUSTIGMA_g9597.t1 [Chlamydomonas eustigma]|eukprot:GAX82169.1 hypothetical protein CEUSTIGMA_g9597.t1 [Chlamydomonas eustigma]
MDCMSILPEVTQVQATPIMCATQIIEVPSFQHCPSPPKQYSILENIEACDVSRLSTEVQHEALRCLDFQGQPEQRAGMLNTSYISNSEEEQRALKLLPLSSYLLDSKSIASACKVDIDVVQSLAQVPLQSTGCRHAQVTFKKGPVLEIQATDLNHHSAEWVARGPPTSSLQDHQDSHFSSGMTHDSAGCDAPAEELQLVLSMLQVTSQHIPLPADVGEPGALLTVERQPAASSELEGGPEHLPAHVGEPGALLTVERQSASSSELEGGPEVLPAHVGEPGALLTVERQPAASAALEGEHEVLPAHVGEPGALLTVERQPAASAALEGGPEHLPAHVGAPGALLTVEGQPAASAAFEGGPEHLQAHVGEPGALLTVERDELKPSSDSGSMEVDPRAFPHTGSEGDPALLGSETSTLPDSYCGAQPDLRTTANRLHKGLIQGDAALSVASVVLTEALKVTMAAAFGTKVTAKHREELEVRKTMDQWELVLLSSLQYVGMPQFEGPNVEEELPDELLSKEELEAYLVNFPGCLSEKGGASIAATPIKGASIEDPKKGIHTAHHSCQTNNANSPSTALTPLFTSHNGHATSPLTCDGHSGVTPHGLYHLFSPCTLYDGIMPLHSGPSTSGQLHAPGDQSTCLQEPHNLNMQQDPVPKGHELGLGKRCEKMEVLFPHPNHLPSEDTEECLLSTSTLSANAAAAPSFVGLCDSDSAEGPHSNVGTTVNDNPHEVELGPTCLQASLDEVVLCSVGGEEKGMDMQAKGDASCQVGDLTLAHISKESRVETIVAEESDVEVLVAGADSISIDEAGSTFARCHVVNSSSAAAELSGSEIQELTLNPVIAPRKNKGSEDLLERTPEQQQGSLKQSNMLHAPASFAESAVYTTPLRSTFSDVSGASGSGSSPVTRSQSKLRSGGSTRGVLLGSLNKASPPTEHLTLADKVDLAFDSGEDAARRPQEGARSEGLQLLQCQDPAAEEQSTPALFPSVIRSPVLPRGPTVPDKPAVLWEFCVDAGPLQTLSLKPPELAGKVAMRASQQAVEELQLFLESGEDGDTDQPGEDVALDKVPAADMGDRTPAPTTHDALKGVVDLVSHSGGRSSSEDLTLSPDAIQCLEGAHWASCFSTVHTTQDRIHTSDAATAAGSVAHPPPPSGTAATLSTASPDSPRQNACSFVPATLPSPSTTLKSKAGFSEPPIMSKESGTSRKDKTLRPLISRQGQPSPKSTGAAGKPRSTLVPYMLQLQHLAQTSGLSADVAVSKEGPSSHPASNLSTLDQTQTDPEALPVRKALGQTAQAGSGTPANLKHVQALQSEHHGIRSGTYLAKPKQNESHVKGFNNTGRKRTYRERQSIALQAQQQTRAKVNAVTAAAAAAAAAARYKQAALMSHRGADAVAGMSASSCRGSVKSLSRPGLPVNYYDSHYQTKDHNKDCSHVEEGGKLPALNVSLLQVATTGDKDSNPSSSNPSVAIVAVTPVVVLPHSMPVVGDAGVGRPPYATAANNHAPAHNSSRHRRRVLLSSDSDSGSPDTLAAEDSDKLLQEDSVRVLPAECAKQQAQDMKTLHEGRPMRKRQRPSRFEGYISPSQALEQMTTEAAAAITCEGPQRGGGSTANNGEQIDLVSDQDLGDGAGEQAGETTETCSESLRGFRGVSKRLGAAKGGGHGNIDVSSHREAVEGPASGVNGSESMAGKDGGHQFQFDESIDPFPQYQRRRSKSLKMLMQEDRDTRPLDGVARAGGGGATEGGRKHNACLDTTPRGSGRLVTPAPASSIDASNYQSLSTTSRQPSLSPRALAVNIGDLLGGLAKSPSPYRLRNLEEKPKESDHKAKLGCSKCRWSLGGCGACRAAAAAGSTVGGATAAAAAPSNRTRSRRSTAEATPPCSAVAGVRSTRTPVTTPTEYPSGAAAMAVMPDSPAAALHEAAAPAVMSPRTRARSSTPSDKSGFTGIVDQTKRQRSKGLFGGLVFVLTGFSKQALKQGLSEVIRCQGGIIQDEPEGPSSTAPATNSVRNPSLRAASTRSSPPATGSVAGRRKSGMVTTPSLHNKQSIQVEPGSGVTPPLLYDGPPDVVVAENCEKRTMRLLCALSRGVAVLSERWVRDCVARCRFIRPDSEPQEYILRPPNPHLRSAGVFSGLRAYLHGSPKFTSDMRKLLMYGGATLKQEFEEEVKVGNAKLLEASVDVVVMEAAKTSMQDERRGSSGDGFTKDHKSMEQCDRDEQLRRKRVERSMRRFRIPLMDKECVFTTVLAGKLPENWPSSGVSSQEGKDVRTNKKRPESPPELQLLPRSCEKPDLEDSEQRKRLRVQGAEAKAEEFGKMDIEKGVLGNTASCAQILLVKSTVTTLPGSLSLRCNLQSQETDFSFGLRSIDVKAREQGQDSRHPVNSIPSKAEGPEEPLDKVARSEPADALRDNPLTSSGQSKQQSRHTILPCRRADQMRRTSPTVSGQEALPSTRTLDATVSTCFLWLDEPIPTTALQATSTSIMSSPHRMCQSGFSLKCGTTGAVHTIRLKDFVELVPQPGEIYPRVVQLDALWSEQPSDNLIRMYIRCTRLYRPQETPFCLGAHATSGLPQVFMSDHVEEMVPVQCVLRRVIVHVEPSVGRPSPSSASSATLMDSTHRSGSEAGKGVQTGVQNLTSDSCTRDLISNPLQSNVAMLQEYACCFHYNHITMLLGSLMKT